MKRRVNDTKELSKGKLYIKKYIDFYNTFLKKKARILMIIAILASVIIMLSLNKATDEASLQNLNLQTVGFWSLIKEKLILLGLTALSGLVPYVYMPIVAFVLYMYNELSEVSNLILVYGSFSGILRMIIPIIINIMAISIITSLGMFICKAKTIKYRISQSSNMNFTNFKIKYYEILNNEKKLETIKKIKDTKISKLNDKKIKVDYIQVINTIILASFLQLISVLIQKILT